MTSKVQPSANQGGGGTGGASVGGGAGAGSTGAGAGSTGGCFVAFLSSSALISEMNGRTPDDPGIYRIGPDAERAYRFIDPSQEPKPYEPLPS